MKKTLVATIFASTCLLPFAAHAENGYEALQKYHARIKSEYTAEKQKNGSRDSHQADASKGGNNKPYESFRDAPSS